MYLQTDELAESRDHLHNVAENLSKDLRPRYIVVTAKRALDSIVDDLSETIHKLEELQQVETEVVYEDDRWEIRVCLCNERCRLCAIDKTRDEEHPNYWLSASDIADALHSAYPEGREWRRRQ